jgi:hypothetical protein
MPKVFRNELHVVRAAAPVVRRPRKRRRDECGSIAFSMAKLCEGENRDERSFVQSSLFNFFGCHFVDRIVSAIWILERLRINFEFAFDRYDAR